jgi:hypothetical protein
MPTRNEACPCGSNERYKNCCGSITKSDEDGSAQNINTSVCFKCGEIKTSPFKKCHSCGISPQSESELVTSLALSEKISQKDHLESFSKTIKNREKPYINEHIFKNARQALKNTGQSYKTKIPHPLKTDYETKTTSKNLNTNTENNSVNAESIIEALTSDMKLKENNLHVGKNKKIVAYLINFFVIGSGIVLIEGSKGITKAFLWLFSFALTLTLLDILWPSSMIAIIFPLLILIASYIHLHHIIKNRLLSDSNIRAINFASNLLKGQSLLFQNGDGSIPLKAKDNWSIGYVAGFSDATLQLSGINNDARGVVIMLFIFIEIYKEEGSVLFEKFSDLQKKSNWEINAGMLRGGNEFKDFIRNNDTIPTAWATHVNKTI